MRKLADRLPFFIKKQDFARLAAFCYDIIRAAHQRTRSYQKARIIGKLYVFHLCKVLQIHLNGGVIMADIYW